MRDDLKANRGSKPENTKARPNATPYPSMKPDNERAVESIDGLRVKSQEPKRSMAMPGRSDYPIPSPTRERAMDERIAKEGKPKESSFTRDMEA